jgi:hypothetical protein
MGKEDSGLGEKDLTRRGCEVADLVERRLRRALWTRKKPLKKRKPAAAGLVTVW